MFSVIISEHYVKEEKYLSFMIKTKVDLNEKKSQSLPQYLKNEY